MVVGGGSLEEVDGEWEVDGEVRWDRGRIRKCMSLSLLECVRPS